MNLEDCAKVEIEITNIFILSRLPLQENGWGDRGMTSPIENETTNLVL